MSDQKSETMTALNEFVQRIARKKKATPAELKAMTEAARLLQAGNWRYLS